MDVQPDIDLVSIFNEVFLVQTYLHKLEIIEEIITDISDFVEDQALPQPSVQLNAMRQQVGQVKIQLRFLLQLKLLEACRRLRQHVLQYGHLPLLNLDFRRWLALILRHHLPTPASARLDATIFPWWQKDHGGSCHRWIKACRLRSFLQHVGISQEHAQQINKYTYIYIYIYIYTWCTITHTQSKPFLTICIYWTSNFQLSPNQHPPWQLVSLKVRIWIFRWRLWDWVQRGLQHDQRHGDPPFS